MNPVEQYIHDAPEPQKTVLLRIQAVVHEAVPDVEETYSYGVPTFKYKGKYLLAFAVAKKHLSIYPGSEAIIANKEALANYDQSKGTIRFTVEAPLPDPLLRAIIKSRLNDILHTQ